LRFPEPENPVAAWRDTKKESGPVGATPELAAHPPNANGNAQTKNLILINLPPI
jgi:hypothetical protein